MSHLSFSLRSSKRSSLPWAMGYRRIHECHRPRPRPWSRSHRRPRFGQSKALSIGFRDQGPGIFSACLSERKTWLTKPLQGLGKEIRFEPCIFFLPRERFGKTGSMSGFLACILWKNDFKQPKNVCGVWFPASNLPRAQLALPMQHIFRTVRLRRWAVPEM